MKPKHIIYYILSGMLLPLALWGQSLDKNLIRTRTYTTEEGSKYLDKIDYFDGLGRPVQSVQCAITPEKQDLVTYQEYDQFGRESNAWLPAVIQNNNGAYVTPASIMAAARTTNTNSGTADQNPYSRPVYEASPLNRVLEQYGPGADWQNTTNKKSVRTGYLTNITTGDSLSCVLYKITDVGDSISLNKTGMYAAGELYVTRMLDEDNNRSYQFKDKLGQVVLTRQIEGNTPHDTYYIYDDFGNLRLVLPPLASDMLKQTISNTPVKDYAYIYKYDHRNRCVRKKLPGCEPIYYVYDKADRLIFTQDGEQRSNGKNEWTFSIPDDFGRIALTGTCKFIRLAGSNTDTPIKSGLFDDKLLTAEYTSPNTYNGYIFKAKDKDNKDLSVVLVTPSILTVNYYDNYNFLNLSGFPTLTYNTVKESEGYGKRYNEYKGYEAKGLLTGTTTAQFDGTTTIKYLYSTMYYDNKQQLIQAKSTNHLGGIEEEYIAYNFTGQPIKKQHIHTATGKSTQTEYYAYEYDHAGRLLKTTHQLQEGTATPKPVVILADNTYDELGRLKTNKKAGQANLETAFTYNIRSWTKTINSPLFKQTLYYNESYGGNKAQYNGNISAMDWNVWDETKKAWEKNRTYIFEYDAISRLKSANYSEENDGNVKNKYTTSYTYDKHGNMKTLVRDGNTNNGIYNTVDNLSMEYTGNQLKYVKDAITTPIYSLSADFKDNTLHKDIEYMYNKNGAMSKDWNKGIDTITYNSLNLPQVMVINSSLVKAKNYYTYSASGVKLKTEQRYDPDLLQSPVQNTDPSNDGLKDYKITDYVGNIIYETEKKGTTAATTKTRILIDGGYIEGAVYYFFLTDHLGNNRVVAKADGTVIQKNHYYPFGMSFAEGTNEKAQPYKYNGKEYDSMHGLNWYDYEARWKAEWYVPTMDPHAEGYYSTSPYAYVMNNPLKYIDPSGMDTVFVTAEGKIEDIFPGGEDINYHSANAVTVTPKENSESVTAIPSSFYPTIISSRQSGRIDGLGINSPEFIALTAWRAGASAVTELARGVFNLMRVSTGTVNTIDANKSGFAAKRQIYANFKKISDSSLKKSGIDAHVVKKEFLGNKAQISHYDLYKDNVTSEVLILLKDGKGIPIRTGYFIK